MRRLVVAVRSADPLTAEGVASMLRTDPDMDVVPIGGMAQADVVVIAGDTLDATAMASIDRISRHSGARIVVLLDEPADAEFRLAARRPVAAVLARSMVITETLVDTVRAADALPHKADEAQRVRHDLSRAGGAAGTPLAPREQQVLRLLADGCDTTEIARHMGYSERTVKKIVRVILDRLGSHTRAHAVAFAVRAGVI